jgi:hypothetical protein
MEMYMRYFNIHLNVDALNPIEAIKILKQYIDDLAEAVTEDGDEGGMSVSMHCTDHDPTIPYLTGSGDWHECKNMNDCTGGCQK